MIWSRKRREAKRALREAHSVALAVAQGVYDRYRDQTTVITEGSGPGYSFVSAASPSREAWDSYFDSMGKQGFSGWDTRKLFERDLVTQ